MLSLQLTLRIFSGDRVLHLLVHERPPKRVAAGKTGAKPTTRSLNGAPLGVRRRDRGGVRFTRNHSRAPRISGSILQQTHTDHSARGCLCPLLQHARELLNHAIPCRLPHARRTGHCGWLRGERTKFHVHHAEGEIRLRLCTEPPARSGDEALEILTFTALIGHVQCYPGIAGFLFVAQHPVRGVRGIRRTGSKP